MSTIITFKCVPDQAHGEFSADLQSFPHEIKPSIIRFRIACDHPPVNGFPCHTVHDLFLEPHKDLEQVFLFIRAQTLAHSLTHTHSHPLSLSSHTHTHTLTQMRSNLRPAYLSFLYSMLASPDHDAVDSAPVPDLANIPEAYHFMARAYQVHCEQRTKVARERLAYIQRVEKHQRSPGILNRFKAQKATLMRAHYTKALQYVTWYLQFDSTQPGNYL